MARFTEQFADDYVVVDLETTGLSSENDTIIELAAVKVINGEIVDEYSSLVDPKRSIPSYITEITGIDNSMVKGKPTIKKVMAEFLKFAGDLPLVGHNFISFDLAFLKKLSDISVPCYDTLRIAKHMTLGSGNSLSALCSYFGIVNDNAHRALSDCIATHKVYRALLEEFGKRGAFITYSAVCGRKLYQKNIGELLKVGEKLTYRLLPSGRTELLAKGEPVGMVPAGKESELSDNEEILSGISVAELKENSKGKLGFSFLIDLHK